MLPCMMRLATLKWTDYIAARMLPAINMEETIGKTVGRRLCVAPLRVLPSETESNKQWRDAGCGTGARRGVYRFKSHEEADQWMMDHLTRKPAN